MFAVTRELHVCAFYAIYTADEFLTYLFLELT